MRTTAGAKARGAVLAALALALVVWWLQPAASRADVPRDRSAATTATVVVVVQPGDTLWEIATRVAPPQASVHETAARIAAANGVDAARLQPGQPLTVPLTDGR